MDAPPPASLVALIEGQSLQPGAALNVGCGTGDAAIYLAERGWRVTGVDSSEQALTAARAKAADLPIIFVRADATQLISRGVKRGFQLVVDTGGLQALPVTQRDAYVDEVSAVAARGAKLLIVADLPRDEVDRLFRHRWTRPWARDEAKHHLLERTFEPPGPKATFDDLKNDFGSYSSTGFVVRMLETTKGMGGRWGRILWGQRPGG